jgi:two-component system osmolarity sensor histidine kinase EnvZ
MNTLISEFLDFSKGVEGHCPVQVDLWKIILSLAEDFEREGAKIRLHRSDPSCVFFADPVVLERVLSNLLENAARYGRDKPIDLLLRCNEEVVSIEICDRGPGIPANRVDKVFRPFERLQADRGAQTGGSGLGLAIVHELAKKYDWSVDLLPREGGGTIARVTFPTSCRFAIERVSGAPTKGAGNIPAPA